MSGPIPGHSARYELSVVDTDPQVWNGRAAPSLPKPATSMSSTAGSAGSP